MQKLFACCNHLGCTLVAAGDSIGTNPVVACAYGNYAHTHLGRVYLRLCKDSVCHLVDCAVATDGDDVAIAVFDNAALSQLNGVLSAARKYGVEVDAFRVENTGYVFPIAPALAAAREQIDNGEPSVVFTHYYLVSKPITFRHPPTECCCVGRGLS